MYLQREDLFGLFARFVPCVFRKLLVFGGGISTAAENRVLHHAHVHPVSADRHVVVGRILDQQELGPGACISRSYYSSDDDDHLSGVQTN